MRFLRRDRDEKKLLELTPVANVVLLLSLFFLLSWSFVLQPGIEVVLPTTSLQAATPHGRHVITLRPGPQEPLIFFDERQVDRQGLQQELATAARKSWGAWITLNADESVSHGEVQGIAESALKRGFRVSLAKQEAGAPAAVPSP